MKDFKKFILTLILTFIMTLPILVYCSNLFMPKWVDHDGNMMTFIMKGFYKEKKNSLDVIFTGNSDVYRGVSPMVLYEKYGITSYNYVSSGQRSWTAYAMLEEILKYQHPQIIMFNVDELYFDNQSTLGNYNKVYDNMKFSSAKIKAIFNKTYENSKTNKIKHFLPILSYHSRYNELTKTDFKYANMNHINPTKGMDLIAKSIPLKYNNNYMSKTNEIRNIPEINLYYLNKMKELCAKKEVLFILFEVPSPDSWNYKKHNALEAYAAKNNLKFLDLNIYNKEIGINWDMDSSDGGDHLNIYGAEKVSNYIADYLDENYNLPDRRNDNTYKNWKKQLEEYKQIKKHEIDLTKNKKNL